MTQSAEEFCREKIDELTSTVGFDDPETKKIFELLIEMVLIPVMVLSPMIGELRKEISEVKDGSKKTQNRENQYKRE